MSGTLIGFMALLLQAQGPPALPGAAPLDWEGDLSARMVAGIDRFLLREIERARAERPRPADRERLRRSIGAADRRLPVADLETVGTLTRPPRIAEAELYAVHAVRWPVFEGVHGEGLLLEPRGRAGAGVVAIPDAGQTPEMLAGLVPGIPPESQFARRLAENGARVLVPVLIDRQDTHSGNPVLGRFTNQPHREWIYRQAFELGRHIIGYEVQKVLAAVDWLAGQGLRAGVAGWGEGGLLAFYSAALDTRIEAALVSGHFAPRERLWEEPIYRNVFGLLRDSGDAEIASLIAPRALIVEHSLAPEVGGPPPPRQGRGGAAPGKLSTPAFEAVKGEAERAKRLGAGEFLTLIAGADGSSTTDPGSAGALSALLDRLGRAAGPLAASAASPLVAHLPDASERQRRQILELVDHTQRLLRRSEYVRRDWWQKAPQNSLEGFQAAAGEYRVRLWNDVIGRFPAASLPPSPRSRQVLERESWTCHEVVLDVWPDVFAWGLLLLPRDLKPGERRPVVVCQHGLEGVPMDTVTDDPKAPGFGAYKAFTARLCERGFITFAPHNPYRGGDRFRVLQRKANPLGRSLFSVILAQHDRILDWLSGLPFVDPARIGFYGLSYGGKTAVRVPPLLERYALSICSADFNEWIKKNATVDDGHSYLYTGEYEMPEFDLGHTFNYAELAALMAPRPFMVERGHTDGVAPDEWVAYEFAKVRRLYAFLGIPGRAEIEFFNGPHTINGAGTFEFLHRHLAWPRRAP